ncbi:hypothetical protein HZS_6359, partial [Henneguya salminicola]
MRILKILLLVNSVLIVGISLSFLGVAASACSYLKRLFVDKFFIFVGLYLLLVNIMNFVLPMRITTSNYYQFLYYISTFFVLIVSIGCLIYFLSFHVKDFTFVCLSYDYNPLMGNSKGAVLSRISLLNCCGTPNMIYPEREVAKLQCNP